MSDLSLSILRSRNQLCFTPSSESSFFDLSFSPSSRINKRGSRRAGAREPGRIGGELRERTGRGTGFLRRRESFLKR